LFQQTSEPAYYIIDCRISKHYNQLFYLGSLGDGDNVNNPGIRLQQQQQQPRVEQITQPLVLGN
jgi:hypothetical protein